MCNKIQYGITSHLEVQVGLLGVGPDAFEDATAVVKLAQHCLISIGRATPAALRGHRTVHFQKRKTLEEYM